MDGTLVDSNLADEQCFLRSFREAFGIARIDSDWNRYEHCTDSWITRAILRTRFGREATQEEVDRARATFLARLREERRERPDGFRAIPGAAVAWSALRDPASGWSVALGSGGWRATSFLKLEAAGLVVDGVPGAFADDALSRGDILAKSQERAEEAVGRRSERVVYVGDALWDVRTCAAARVPFVGIGRGDRARRLRDAGAPLVLPDLENRDRLLDALAGATVPEPAPA